MTRRWLIDIGAAPTQTYTIMTDRYRCGLDSKTDMTGRWPIDIGAAPTQTQTDKMMTDRYRCGPDSKTDMTGRWPIDIGAAPTQTELIGWWWEDDRVTQSQMILRWRCKQTRQERTCPSMTTHEDQRLGQKITKPMRGLMILGKGGMPQYATQGS